MHRGGGSGELHQGDQPPQFAQDGGASGCRAFSVKTRKVLGRWGPLGHLTHGRGSVLFVDGRREVALSLARGVVTAALLWSFLLTQGPDQHGRGLHRPPVLALLWSSELDDTQGLFSDFQTTTDREEPCEQASMCGGGARRETNGAEGSGEGQRRAA